MRVIIIIALLLAAVMLVAQNPTKEYIYLGGRLIAIENNPNGGSPGSGELAIIPPSMEYGAKGGPGTATVVAPPGTNWSPSSNALWLTLKTPIDQSKGRFEFTVSENSGAQRNGAVTVNGKMLSILQKAPEENVPPTIAALTQSGNLGGIYEFEFTYADGNGNGDLDETQVLINSGLDGTSGYYFVYKPHWNPTRLFLWNQAQYSWLEAFPGATTPTYVSSSYCTLDAAFTTPYPEGNNLRIKTRITPLPSLARPSNIYMWTRDLATPQRETGWIDKGDFTAGVTNSPPVLLDATGGEVSQGSAKIMTFRYHDSNTRGDLKTLEGAMSPADSRNECRFSYDMKLGIVQLMDPTTGNPTYPPLSVLENMSTDGMIENAHCAINASGSSISPSGDSDVSLALHVTFKTSGMKQVSMRATDLSGGLADWTAKNTLNVQTTAPNQVPTATAVSTNTPGQFAATYRDGNGYADITGTHLQITGAGNAWCRVERNGNYLTLIESRLGQTPDSQTYAPIPIGGSGFVSGLFCALNGATSSVAPVPGDPNLLTVVYGLQVTEMSWNGLQTFLTSRVFDTRGATSSAPFAWYIVASPPSTSPTAVSANGTPLAGNGLVSWTAVYSDPNGFTDISEVQLVIGPSGDQGCYIIYKRALNQLYMAAAGGNFQGPITPGANARIGTKYCTLFGQGTSIQTSGNDLTLTAKVQFWRDSQGVRDVWIFAMDNAPGAWKKATTWTVPQGLNAAPVVDTYDLIPPGGGLSASLALYFIEPNSDMKEAQAVVGPHGAAGCYVIYKKSTNLFYLAEGSTLTQGLTPGSPGTVSTHYCTLNAELSYANESAIMVQLDLKRYGTFTGGPQPIKVWAIDIQGAESGWIQVGTWDMH